MRSEQPNRRATGTRIVVAIFAAGAFALGGVGIFLFEKRPEISPVAEGARLAVSSGCFACHGRSEAERSVNFRQLASGAWRSKAIPTFWENGIDQSDVLVDWITNGVPAKEAANHKRLFIQMPAYRGFLRPAEIDAISAWILAEGLRLSQNSATTAAPPAPLDAAKIHELTPDRLLVLGDRISRRAGCYQCHGELGQGGGSNIASFKGYIPGFFGHDFLELTANGDRTEIRHWIDHGRGHAVETGVFGGLAKRFFDRQAIGMPPYRERLSESEKNILAEFLILLNGKGPLSAKTLEPVARLLNDDSPSKTDDNQR